MRRTIKDLDLRGKRVLIRQDLNVPVKDGKVTSDQRILASLPTLRLALEQGAAVMVTSHLGRPKEGSWTAEDSLAPVAARLSELLGFAVRLQRDWVDGVAVQPGELVLLENCRMNVGEGKTCSSWMRSAPRTAPRPRRMASSAPPRWPAAVRCLWPNSTHWPRR